jgi:tripartite-type tricarboxylate transporter receptor subunit TctC
MKGLLSALAFASALPFAAHAQNYPTQPIRIVVGAGAGGGVDTSARIVAQNLPEALGQSGVVENRGGAGGALAGDLVAKSAPDGHTLVAQSIGHATLPSIHKNLPYSPERDLVPITIMVNSPNVLVAHPSLPMKTVKELIAYAKKHPGKIDYASTGVGSPSHLATELLKLLAGIDLVHVPYKSTGAGMTDVMAGRVSTMFGSFISTRAHVQQGKLKVLATAGSKRAAAAPDLPTIAEAGVPGYAVDVWYALLAPSATPRPVLEKLNAAVTKILHAPDVTAKLATLGLEPVGQDLAASAAYVKAEIAKWAKVVKAANITPN